MSDIFLKPCPFCGGKAGILYTDRAERFTAACRRCGMVYCQAAINDEGNYVDDDFCNTPEEAAELWNRRYNEESNNDT